MLLNRFQITQPRKLETYANFTKQIFNNAGVTSVTDQDKERS